MSAKSLELISQLSKPLQSTQLAAINRTLASLDPKTAATLRSYYAYLLQRLAMKSPRRALAKLMAAIADPTVVSQPRVNRLCALYARDPDPAFARVLRAMRAHAPPSIYFPPTGQATAENAQIPAALAEKLHSLDAMIPVYAEIANTLQRGSPLTNATAIAQLYPLAAASGIIMLPIEEYFYRFLEGWDGSRSPVISILIKYFRFWPEMPPSRLKQLLLEPLARAKNPHAIFEALAGLGARAEPLALELYERIGEKHYIPLLLFYKQTGAVPPPDLIYRLILNYPALLFICRLWANSLPEIKNALQGEPTNLVGSLALDPDELALANNPWLGNITTASFEEMADAPCTTKITEKLLELEGITYADFCNYLLDRLAALGLYIDEYLC